MSVSTHYIPVKTKGDTDIIDITNQVANALKKSKLNNGTLTIFVSGSTGGITTVEYEPGLLEDLPALFDRIAPKNITYQHDNTWHDGNGHSHARASLLGASLSVPFTASHMLLGTWQQIIFIDFDNKPRSREIIIQIMGE